MAYRRQRSHLAKRAAYIALGTFTDEVAAAYGDLPAIYLQDPFEGSSIITFDGVRSAVARLAGGLRTIGLKPGDRVAICMNNRFEALAAQWATWRAGGQIVPINHLNKGPEIRYLIEDSGASLFITDADVFERNIRSHGALPERTTWVVAGEQSFTSLMAAPPAEAHVWEASAPCAILYTSGTTGMPKGAVQTADYFADAMRRMAKGMKYLPRPGGSFGILGHPLAHVTGVSMAWSYFVAGRPFLLMRRFTGEGFLKAIESHRATFFMGVPAMYAMAMEAGPERHDLSSMRVWFCGGDYMPPELVRKLQRIGGRPLRKTTVIETYGQAEVGPAVKPRLWGFPRYKPGCVGWPMRVKYAVMDEQGKLLGPGKTGEIVAQKVQTSYWNRPQETAESWREGWFHTGDLGWKDRLGRLYLADRKKDVIKCGGYSVFSREVEEELKQHPAIRECAVVGVPHPVKGEMPVAVVTLRSEATAEELVAWCKENIADYKAPRHVEIADELPMASGVKVAKAELRDRLKNLYQ